MAVGSLLSFYLKEEAKISANYLFYMTHFSQSYTLFLIVLGKMNLLVRVVV